MAEWSKGYETETPYIYYFGKTLSPTYLKMICRFQGVSEPEGPLTYLDLGCGQGLAPNILAASNPHDTFIGVDFMPSHILGAQKLAKAANLKNVSFLEQSFEALASHPDRLPQCDIICVHGIYSWVSPTQRAEIRAIINSNLKPGGLLYLSYNCAAGWGSLGNFQKLLRDLALSHGSGGNQTTITLEYLKTLRDAEFGFFKTNAAVNDLLDTVLKINAQYVRHEYMNAFWNPLHFQDVAAEMRECKLSFVGSANPAENLEHLSLPEKLASLVREEPDRDLRESMKDLHVNRRFRRDVYVKGNVSLSLEERDHLLRNMAFALLKPRSEIGAVVKVPRGQLTMGKPGYAEALTVLERRPSPLGPIEEKATALLELMTILVEGDLIHPVVDHPADPEPTERLNLVMTRSRADLTRYHYVASPVLGSGLSVSPDYAPLLTAQLRGQQLENDQSTLDQILFDPNFTPFFEANPAEPRSRNDLKIAYLSRVPVWRHLGILN